MVSIISFGLNLVELPAFKKDLPQCTAGYETWIMEATLIEKGVVEINIGICKNLCFQAICKSGKILANLFWSIQQIVSMEHLGARKVCRLRSIRLEYDEELEFTL